MQTEPSELASNGYLYHIESWSRLRRQDYLFEIPRLSTPVPATPLSAEHK